MTLKKKLTLGLGFLFLIIFVLVVFYSYYIGKLSNDAENILKDNYKSLVYSKNMISALEDMRTAVSSIVFNPTDDKTTSAYYLKLFDDGTTEFEGNLKSENGNITEIHEKEYAATVNQGYVTYASLCRRIINGERSRALYFGEFQPAFEQLRHAINNITDINMQAVERKNLITKRDSARIVDAMAVIGIFCLILAFVYFWYFPFYISNSIAYLSARMKGLLKKSDIVLDIKTNDESYVILQAINLMENKLDAKGTAKDSAKDKKKR
jgi:NtrC-family two-component system sensor histidine kinase KinB